ncbi:MAG: hypothetical protein CME06_12150 [Gemmatimonadetes bacterium]|nr:hypothetical protein [Gemmatimonadota bacterium]
MEPLDGPIALTVPALELVTMPIIEEECTMSLLRCRITGNWSSDFGGGLRAGACGTLTLDDCVISGNSAGGLYGAEGGRLLFGGERLEMTGCSFKGNRAAGDDAGGDGGGLLLHSPSAYIQRRVFSGNSAVLYDARQGASGGAIYLSSGSLVMEHCTIRNNRATSFNESQGGGLIATGGVASLNNCIIAGNRATGEPGTKGGGLHGPVELSNCTIVDNVADNDTSATGGGIFGAATLTNCILWGNLPNQIANASVVTYCDVQDGHSGAGNFSSTPRFTSWGDLDYLLQPLDRWVGDTFVPRSPCIDAGDPTIEDGVFDLHPRWPDHFPNAARSDDPRPSSRSCSIPRGCSPR